MANLPDEVKPGALVITENNQLMHHGTDFTCEKLCRKGKACRLFGKEGTLKSKQIKHVFLRRKHNRITHV